MMRRPTACRPPDDRHPAHEPEAPYRTFEYREEALAAAQALTGYEAFPQYVGAYDLWIVEAKRKTWPSFRVLMANGTVTR
jgi:hypothetical protein